MRKYEETIQCVFANLVTLAIQTRLEQISKGNVVFTSLTLKLCDFDPYCEGGSEMCITR